MKEDSIFLPLEFLYSKNTVYISSYLDCAQIVITDYCCGPPERWDDEFREYLKDRNYRLVQVEEYAKLLSDAGFQIIKACNHTKRYFIQFTGLVIWCALVSFIYV